MPDMLNRYSISSDILIVTDAASSDKPFLRRNTEMKYRKKNGKRSCLLPFLPCPFLYVYVRCSARSKYLQILLVLFIGYGDPAVLIVKADLHPLRRVKHDHIL